MVTRQRGFMLPSVVAVIAACHVARWALASRSHFFGGVDLYYLDFGPTKTLDASSGAMSSPHYNVDGASLGTRGIGVAGPDFRTLLMTFRGFLGARLPLGRLSLRLEEQAGAAMLSVGERSSVGDLDLIAWRGVLETRALFDVWATSTMTLSVFGGVDAIDAHGRTAGLVLEFHGRAFDGTFAVW